MNFDHKKYRVTPEERAKILMDETRSEFDTNGLEDVIFELEEVKMNGSYEKLFNKCSTIENRKIRHEFFIPFLGRKKKQTNKNGT